MGRQLIRYSLLQNNHLILKAQHSSLAALVTVTPTAPFPLPALAISKNL